MRGREEVRGRKEVGYLNAVIAVGEVVEGLVLLVDDADAGFVRAARYLLDILCGFPARRELGIDLLRGLDGGLGVEFSGVGDLEEHILHDVAAVRPLELEFPPLEQHVVEAPCGRRQHGRHAGLAALDFENEVHGALAGVAGGPGFARHGVRGVPVGAQALAVDPGLGDGVCGLAFGEAEHLGDDGCGGDFDEDDVVEADFVEGVFEGEAALDFVRFDHGFEDVFDCQDCPVADLPPCAVGSGYPVCDGEDAAEVV